MFSPLNSSPIEGLALIITLVGNALLILAVYSANPKSATHRIFILLNLVTTFWLIDTYVVRLPALLPVSLTIHRFGIFFAAGMSFLFFLLAHTIPSESIRMQRKTLYLSLTGTICMMAMNLSPFAFTDVVIVGGMSEPVAGLGLLPFSVLSTVFSALAIFFLARSYRNSCGNIKNQVGWVLIGIVLMLGFITFTILLPLELFNSTLFLPLTPLYTLVFLGFTAYAITKYQLFNIKVLLTQSLVISINVILFAKIFQEITPGAQLLDIFVLALMLVFGFFLVDSVKNEVHQRELIEKQEQELEVNNARLRELDKQKTEFLSFASHQLRTPLTAIKWSAAAVLDGSYGDVPEHLRDPMQTIFDYSVLMAVFINDYLNVSRIEQGRMEYRFAAINLAKTIEDSTKELRAGIKKKGLTLTLNLPQESVMVWADPDKLIQVFTNIIDNAMKYTPQGGITVTLERRAKEGLVRAVISDTGIGMNEETRKTLFAKFTRGDNARQVNSSGSGLGLFIVKTFIEAHKGTINIESDGLGKGSRFILDFPLLVEQGAATA